MSNWNTTDQQNTKMLILGFGSNKKHLCRRATASAKIQVRATLSFHPNLFLSTSKRDCILVQWYFKLFISPDDRFIACWVYPIIKCILTQGISMPHPETQTVDWVMLVTPGFCQATSRCTVDLFLARFSWLLDCQCDQIDLGNPQINHDE